MKTKKMSSSTQKKRSPSKKKEDPAPLLPEKTIDPRKRLNVFVINSGRPDLANRVLTESMDMLKNFLINQNLFILSANQSIAFLRSNPEYVGRDPLLVVVDPSERNRKTRYGFGTVVALGQCYWTLGRNKHLHLTKVQLEELISMFIRTLNSQDENTDIAGKFHKVNHQVGVMGTINIVMDSIGQEALHLAEE